MKNSFIKALKISTIITGMIIVSIVLLAWIYLEMKSVNIYLDPFMLIATTILTWIIFFFIMLPISRDEGFVETLKNLKVSVPVFLLSSLFQLIIVFFSQRHCENNTCLLCDYVFSPFPFYNNTNTYTIFTGAAYPLCYNHISFAELSLSTILTYVVVGYVCIYVVTLILLLATQKENEKNNKMQSDYINNIMDKQKRGEILTADDLTLPSEKIAAAKKQQKEETNEIIKGAVIGGIIAGNAGAITGAIIAKNNIDNKKKK